MIPARTAGVLHLQVDAASVGRALRLTQALIDEALRRGYEVGVFSGYRSCGGLAIYIQGHGFELFVSEENDRTPHQPSKQELERAARYDWEWIPEWDYVPSGRLQLWVGHNRHPAALSPGCPVPRL